MWLARSPVAPASFFWARRSRRMSMSTNSLSCESLSRSRIGRLCLVLVLATLTKNHTAPPEIKESRQQAPIHSHSGTGRAASHSLFLLEGSFPPACVENAYGKAPGKALPKLVNSPIPANALALALGLLKV